MALFSRDKKPAAQSTSGNRWLQVVDQAPEPEAPQTEPVAPVYPPRPVGRPGKEAPRRRVSISVDPEVHARWAEAADGAPVARWARRVLDEHLEDQDADSSTAASGGEVRRLRADLGRVGSNLNQLMRAVNQGQVVASDELLEAVEATRVELGRVREVLS